MSTNSVNLVGAENINYSDLRGKIYKIRGQEVMLDYDLAEIYGYNTSAFNQQVARNKEKFEGEDFMFRLTEEDLAGLSISHFVISMQTRGERGGRTKMPYAFTEQGIYMLMTVLRGELAVRQSRALIRLFKSMKDHIVESQVVLEYRDNLKLIAEMIENDEGIAQMKGEMLEVRRKVEQLSREMGDVVTKSEISPVLLGFSNNMKSREFLILDGQPARAAETYIDIYGRAIKTVFIIDDYINLKTLRLLQGVKPGVEVVVFSDNVGKYLHKHDYVDFRREFPGVKIDFIKTCGKIHDRFIALDYSTDEERFFQCGASSKDAGNSITMIHEFEDEIVKKAMHGVVERLLKNPELELR